MMISSLSRFLCSVLFCLLGFVGAVARAESYVEFGFDLKPTSGSAFAREVWADVQLPDGKTLRLPAFYAGGKRFAVRAAATMPGAYVLRSVTEQNGGGRVTLDVPLGTEHVVSTPQARSMVRIDDEDRSRFVDAQGRTYFPVGMNVAWPDGNAGIQYYRDTFPAMAREQLNWSRVWMSHWGRLNLDWVIPEVGESPKPGELDLEVAQRWDELVRIAEEHGIYVQLVLQHHGQYSTRVNPNWDENPWNAAVKGGFLKTPNDFFTSEEARRHTRMKYRYIVARWGYSPAILAWELFNEVHFTDALHVTPIPEAVAAWHREMAAYIRSVDAHGHLVTSSLQELHGGVADAMDYRQPHLYAPNMLASVRYLPGAEQSAPKPLFHGEVGDEQMVLTPAQQKSAVALVPPVWASLTGDATHAAQIWYGNRMVDTKRLPELGAVSRMAHRSGYAEQRGLRGFDVAVDSEDRTSLVLPAGHWWVKSANADIRIPTDGREPAEYATVGRALVGHARARQEGYPWRAAFTVTYPEASTLRVKLGDAGPQGARFEVLVDGRRVAQHEWPSRVDRHEKPKAGAPALEPMPAELAVPIAAGTHSVVLDNRAGPDYVILNAIDFGVPVPKIAASGRRNEAFIFVWAWNRLGVFAVEDQPAARATLKIDNVPAGTWKITWWNSLTGHIAEETTREHDGGDIALPTPPISRHAAVVLSRVSDTAPGAR